MYCSSCILSHPLNQKPKVGTKHQKVCTALKTANRQHNLMKTHKEIHFAKTYKTDILNLHSRTRTIYSYFDNCVCKCVMFVQYLKFRINPLILPCLWSKVCLTAFLYLEYKANKRVRERGFVFTCWISES